MKKILSLLLCFVMIFSFAACSNGEKDNADNPAAKTKIRIAALKGPTGIGMLNLMDRAEKGETANDYTIQLAGSPDLLKTQLLQGEVDMAAVPTNLASVLYNKTEGQVQMVAINTLGVLYILENGETVQNIQDLKKKKVLMITGRGSTPEFVLNHILEENKILPGQDIAIESKTEHAELAAMMSADKVDLCLLPQPFVTSVLKKNPKVRIALDMQKEWQKIEDEELAMGCIVVNKEFAKNNKQAVIKFLEEYQASTEYANKSIEETAALAEKYEIMPQAVAKEAIPYCNIVYLAGEDMKDCAEEFLQVMEEVDKASIGGKLPGEDFYFQK